MIKIFHEAPNSIFNKVRDLTNGDYCLVHLLDENDEYLSHFMESKSIGREIILDNSVFELGDAYDDNKFVDWIDILNPEWYIIPDVLRDGFKTLNNVANFEFRYSGLIPGKPIAVAQGSSLYEMLYCFEQLHDNPFVEMIAIPFNFNFYGGLYTHKNSPILEQWMHGRVSLIHNFLHRHYIDGRFYKPVHLLGASLPQEGLYYGNINWIYSTDTSNPVVAGYEGVRYNYVEGLKEKSSTKLFTIIDNNVDDMQLENIIYNIKTFSKIWN